MIFKLCFNDQIHRCPKTPTSLESLRLTIQQTFKEAIPSSFSVSYVDKDGNPVFISTEADFEKMMTSNTSQSIKIYVAPAQKEDPEPIKESNEQQYSIQDSYQILQNRSDADSQDAPKNQSFLDGIANSNSVVLKHSDIHKNAESVQNEDKPIEPEPKVEEPSNAVEIFHIKTLKKEIPEHKPEAPVEQPQLQNDIEQEVPQAVEHKAPEEIPVHKEEFKQEEDAQVAHANDNQFIDLTNKKTLQAFIIQTIEEAMPQLMANYLAKQEQQQNKDKKDNIATKIKDTGFSLAGVVEKVSKGVEKMIIGEKSGLNAKLVEVQRIIPENITTSDEEIYSQVIVRNNGTIAFPNTTILQCVAGLNSFIADVPALEPRKEHKLTLRTQAPKKAGNYITKWRFIYSDERNMSQTFGEDFELKFHVENKKYSREVTEKAQQLKAILPQTSIETYLEFVNQDPKKSIEQLIEEYLLNNPSN